MIANQYKFEFLLSQNTFTSWLNHYSALMCLKEKIDLSRIDFIGIDGIFLRMILGRPVKRTSADTVLPELLKTKNIRVGIVGGSEEQAKKNLQNIRSNYPDLEVCWSLGGYSNNLVDVICEKNKEKFADLIILGLGTPLQEKVGIELSKVRGVLSSVVTCGGWLDQISHKPYYPRWAYPLRLNWLVRLSKEPRRLWKRYSIHALAAIVSGSKLRKLVDRKQLI